MYSKSMTNDFARTTKPQAIDHKYGRLRSCTAEIRRLVHPEGRIDVESLSMSELQDLDIELARQLVDAHRTEDLNLDGLTSLTVGVATVLSDHDWVLKLNGLATMSEAVVLALAAHKGIGMWLNGLTSLSPHAAAALAHPRAFRCLDGIQELVPAAAEAIAQHDGGPYMSGLTSLTNLSLARKLATNNSPLSLDHLSVLSDEIAQALGQRFGYCLSLNSLVDLSPVAALPLTQVEHDLKLNGLRTLPEALGESLLQHMGALELNGIVEAADEALEAMMPHCDDLSLNRRTQLSARGATALARVDGSLRLNALESIDDAALQALATHRGEFLSLDRLKTLTVVTGARALAAHGGHGSLGGLTAISPDVARALARSNDWLILDGLTTIDPPTAAASAKHGSGLSLNGLSSIDEESAAALAKHRGLGIALNGVRTLSTEEATQLATYEGGSTSFAGLKRLPCLALLERLARQPGFLKLSGFTRPTADEAKLPTLYYGRINSSGLASVDLATAKPLAEHREAICFNGVTYLSDGAADAIARRQRQVLLGKLKETNSKPCRLKRILLSTTQWLLRREINIENACSGRLQKRTGLHA